MLEGNPNPNQARRPQRVVAGVHALCAEGASNPNLTLALALTLIRALTLTVTLTLTLTLTQTTSAEKALLAAAETKSAALKAAQEQHDAAISEVRAELAAQ